MRLDATPEAMSYLQQYPALLELLDALPEGIICKIMVIAVQGEEWIVFRCPALPGVFARVTDLSDSRTVQHIIRFLAQVAGTD